MGRLALVVVAVLALAGCTSPAPASTPTTTPSPTSVADDRSPASIVVTADRVSVETTAGDELEGFAFTDDAATTVALLTDLLGTPEITEVPGLEQPAYTDYNWTGFELHVLAAGSEPYPPLRVKVSVTTVSDLLVTTIDGLSVGVDADTVAGRYPESTLSFGSPLRYAVTLGESGGYTVGLEGAAGGPITSITAPQLG